MTEKKPMPSLPTVHFDTSALAPKERFDAWHQNMSVFFDLAAFDGGKPKTDMNGKITACNLGEAVFGVTRSDAQLFERQSVKIARDHMDHILVQVFLEGGGITDRDEKISAGDMFVIDLDKAHAMKTTAFKNLTLVLPRVSIPDLSELLSSLHGQRLSAQNPMIRFMGEHLKALWQNVPDMNASEAAGMLNGSLGLMESWLSHDGRLVADSTPDVSVALGKSIKQHIERHLSEPMTPQKLVKQFRISRSQIYRIFAPYGGVARYIWERRMIRSRYMLTKSAFNHMTVGSVGYACGFLSESHFSRTFKSRFGVSPSEVRLTEQDANVMERDLCDRGPLFPSWISELPKNSSISIQP
ncbi:helix-turn-helix domain-containing protein [Terasakiella pusilla]|uniref:helix-turn-helix domain-containing protein n=1 Tax=Terasakiella pusilla TaxID=64973 RepID=UPI003AA900A4